MSRKQNQKAATGATSRRFLQFVDIEAGDQLVVGGKWVNRTTTRVAGMPVHFAASQLPDAKKALQGQVQ